MNKEERIVDDDSAGMRFDRYCRKALGRTGLADIYKMIRTGRVRVNGKKADQSYRLASGDRIELTVPSAELTDAKAAPRDVLRDLVNTDFFKRSFKIIFEDECLLIVDKPAGLVVHPGSGHESADSLIECAQSYLLETSRTGEPSLAHRIDRDTSGVVIMAKDKTTLRSLTEAFREGAVGKNYLAICHGVPKPPRGTIDALLTKTYEQNDGTKMSVSKNGVEARTDYKTVESKGGISLLDLTLHTGRTHQIRVHCAHIKCPVVGDLRYGDKEADSALFSSLKVPRRLYLHSSSARFRHPVTGVEMTIDAPRPPAFAALLDSAAHKCLKA